MAEEVRDIDFAQRYFLLRKKEGRIYSDKEVAVLPEINSEHSHYQEWHVRKDSSKRFVNYLINKEKDFEILEVGCGNGWLSAKLSAIPRSSITGIDINTEELNQAKRVFNQINNLEFFNCSLEDEILSAHKFDIIVFAASVQYFFSLEKAMNDSLKRLKPGGEVHVIDSHFYRRNEIDAARLRTSEYYRAIGFPEMSQQYFHHSLEDMKSFDYDILFDPGSIVNKLKKNKNPFYWVCVKYNA